MHPRFLWDSCFRVTRSLVFFVVFCRSRSLFVLHHIYDILLAFQNKKLESVSAAQSRPNTLTEKKDGSTLPTQSRNKSFTTGNQHKGAHIKQVAKLMTKRYGQEENSSNSKDTPKQVPLWLVHQVSTLK